MMNNQQPDVDSHKLIYHPKRVFNWLEEKDCHPIYIEIGPTNRCNHKCIFCALDWVNRGGYNIDKEVMLSALKNMAESGVKSVMFAGEGEPLLHKDIALFIEKAKECGLDVSLTTNGVLFNKKMADSCLKYLSWIRFSIDAGTQEGYKKIHQCGEKDFEKVIENIKYASEIKNKNNLKTIIGVQILLIPENISELVKLAETVKEAGADNLQVKPYSQHPLSINRFVIDYKDYAHLESELEKLNSDNFKVLFRKKTMERLQEKPKYKECHGLSFFCLVDAKGDIIPCNLYYDNLDFIYGNLYENTFSEIWKSEKRKKVLEKLREKGVEVCRENCRLDPVNRYLHELLNPHPHVNFI